MLTKYDRAINNSEPIEHIIYIFPYMYYCQKTVIIYMNISVSSKIPIRY